MRALNEAQVLLVLDDTTDARNRFWLAWTQVEDASGSVVRRQEHHHVGGLKHELVPSPFKTALPIDILHAERLGQQVPTQQLFNLGPPLASGYLGDFKVVVLAAGEVFSNNLFGVAPAQIEKHCAHHELAKATIGGRQRIQIAVEPRSFCLPIGGTSHLGLLSWFKSPVSKAVGDDRQVVAGTRRSLQLLVDLPEVQEDG